MVSFTLNWLPSIFLSEDVAIDLLAVSAFETTTSHFFMAGSVGLAFSLLPYVESETNFAGDL